MNNTNILLRHNYVDIPASNEEVLGPPVSVAFDSKGKPTKAAQTFADKIGIAVSELNRIQTATGEYVAGRHQGGVQEAIATVLMNLAYYGYALNAEGYRALVKLGPTELANWWVDVETELESITGADRKIGDFVVYKNFPAEVLQKSEAEYWIPQLLMYWGFPKEFFTEEVKPRDKMDEEKRPIVLQKAKKTTLRDILESHLKSPARWKDQELQEVLFLTEHQPVNLAKLVFKENLVSLASHLMQSGRTIHLSTATDVLRLGAGLSDGDVSLREKTQFKSFKRSERKFLLSLLQNCTNLAEDAARRPELFKRFLHQLHPGDYQDRFPNVWQVNQDLYHDRLQTFNSKVETLLLQKDPEVLKLLASRPGEFRRRLVQTLELFGNKAVKAFTTEAVLDQLTTAQVVSLRSYLETVNQRQHRTFPPKGNWTKMQVGEARGVVPQYVKTISKALGKVLAKRVPAVQFLDNATKLIKLPSNDGEVSPYNRGTVFPIPEEVKFIRTASYWQSDRNGVVWFDNGWNFFDSDWKSMGACCWTSVKFGRGDAAVFSGDPVNTTEMEGRAAQLIDLYPDKLLKCGVKYAVWNILCFSRVPFSKVNDVFAALQWGTDPQKGNLFEPSRCQLQFPLTGDSLTKYVCVIDLETREMIYIDANLYGKVQSADRNGKGLEKNLPPFMEYIKSLPSVHDLFRESVDKGSRGAYVLYTDKETELKNVPAYVFRPENQNNKFKSVDLNSILT